MIRNIYIIIIVLISVNLYCQEAPKKASKIICETQNENVFNEITKGLLSIGFPISNYDKEVGFIITEFSDAFEGLFFSTQLTFNMIENAVEITGQFEVDLGEFGHTKGKIQNKGMKGSASRDSFNNMHSFVTDHMNCDKIKFN